MDYLKRKLLENIRVYASQWVWTTGQHSEDTRILRRYITSEETAVGWPQNIDGRFSQAAEE